MAALEHLGRISLSFLSYLGQLIALTRELAAALFHRPFRFRLICRQLVTIGFGSQLVVVVTGAFTGAVLAAQSNAMFTQVGLESAGGIVVSLALCRELGPVLTGLMLAGRVGAAMTAEIGTMKVTEQIDALRAMGVHPIDYLVVPRFVGMVISIPLLIAESLSFGLIASYVISVHLFRVNVAHYLSHLTGNTDLVDVAIGMSKGFAFGILIVLICCHQGLIVRKGAVGVGRATTSAVVISSLAILIVNFFMTLLINIFFPISVA